MMRAVPRTVPVLWLNVQTQPTYPAHPESVNHALAAARGRGRTSARRHDRHFRNHPELHIADGLHFTPPARSSSARLIAGVLRRCARRSGRAAVPAHGERRANHDDADDPGERLDDVARGRSAERQRTGRVARRR